MPTGPTTPRIRLYTYAMSPFAAKVHCFLLYKRLPFECFYIHPFRVKQDLPVGRQIPAVTIGDESRADSTPIGLWLDECFPEQPHLLPEGGDEREQLLKIDEWVSHCLIPSSFRYFPGEGLDRWRNGWNLSRVMSKTANGGLSPILRAAWPLLIKNVPFVRRLIAQADDGLPLRESKTRVYQQFIAHLADGPFLAGRDAPSLPDLAAYPQFALYYLTGFRGGDDILEFPEIMEWLVRMRPFVSGTPPLVPAAVRRQELP
ncbi:MAG: glutathione S-transferase family protein [bacterium]|nr:glutathione S-transferase family protein [bacterium]